MGLCLVRPSGTKVFNAYAPLAAPFDRGKLLVIWGAVHAIVWRFCHRQNGGVQPPRQTRRSRSDIAIVWRCVTMCVTFGVGAPNGRCSRMETADKAKKLAYKFSKRFLGFQGGDVCRSCLHDDAV